jgi:DNA-binding transcriptional LysR family regulator
MDSLNGIAVFVQVAESRSLVLASRLLGVSASAVGKSVARLEAKLGTRLFHRSTRSITLTAEGQLFLQRSRRILAELEAAQLELTQIGDAPRGRLRISLPRVSALLLPVLGGFMRNYPEIELDLDFSDRLVDVIEEGFDAVVRAGPPADSRLTARFLGRFQMQLVAAPDYLARRGTPQTPADLLQHSCLHYRWSQNGKLESWALPRAPGEAELQLPCSMICNNIETRLSFALQGLGIAHLPDFSVRQALRAGQLQEVLPGQLSGSNVIHILWPASKYPTPKVRALVDFLSDRVLAAPDDRLQVAPQA